MPENDYPKQLRRRAPVFRPSFTLMLVYLLVFFVLFAVLAILPELLPLLEKPAVPALQEEAERVARDAASGRLIWALLLAIGTVGLGAYLQVLPGLKRPG